MSEMGDMYRYQMQLPRNQAKTRPAKLHRILGNDNESVPLLSEVARAVPLRFPFSLEI